LLTAERVSPIIRISQTESGVGRESSHYPLALSFEAEADSQNVCNPCSLWAIVGSTVTAGLEVALLKVVWYDRERHRRGDPKRPATLWTVAYRLGPSFRGL
jgi:hypothetical protein